MEALLYIVGILAVVLGLGISIALHEIGHLVPAKLFRLRVGQYMIGFGPTLWKRRVGETEYGVKALPVGGYISMAGMYPPSPRDRTTSGRIFGTLVQEAREANDETLDGAGDRVFYALPVWKRVIIMLGGPFMNLVLAVVIFTILFSGIGVQQQTTLISSVSQCALPAGSTVTSCAPGDPVAPAAAAGLQPGDRILSVDGAATQSFAQLSDLLRAAPGKTLSLVVERNGATMTLPLTPMLAQRPVYDAQGKAVANADGTPQTAPVGFAGVTGAVELVRQPLWSGAVGAVENAKAVVGILAQLPAKIVQTATSLVSGGERDPEGLVSVVGVGRIAGEMAAADAPVLNRVAGILSVLGSLNIALFVFNLIPLLPLDGGHVVVALWDGLKRLFARMTGRPRPKPADATRLVPLTMVVVVLLIGVGAVLILADLFNPIKVLG